MHRELASRSFTDALLRLAGDRVYNYTTCGSKTRLTLTFVIVLEHTCCGEVKDTGEDGRMDRNVLKGTGFGNHGTSLS